MQHGVALPNDRPNEHHVVLHLQKEVKQCHKKPHQTRQNSTVMPLPAVTLTFDLLTRKPN